MTWELASKSGKYEDLCRLFIHRFVLPISINISIQVETYAPIPAEKHRKSLERGSSIPTGILGSLVAVIFGLGNKENFCLYLDLVMMVQLIVSFIQF